MADQAPLIMLWNLTLDLPEMNTEVNMKLRELSLLHVCHNN